jgi:hypothetical protein
MPGLRPSRLKLLQSLWQRTRIHLVTPLASEWFERIVAHTSPISVAYSESGLVIVDGHKRGTGISERVSWHRHACAGSTFCRSKPEIGRTCNTLVTWSFINKDSRIIPVSRAARKLI